MKKPSLLIAFISCLASLSGQERLAVFAIEKDDSGKLPCISIDFFRSIPNGELYGPIGDHFTPKYKATGHTRFDGKAKADLSAQTHIGYFGWENEPVPLHYCHFLDALFHESRSMHLDDDSLYALQDKVWTYNVLDELGFIDHDSANQQEQYRKAKEQFIFRYGLSNDPPPADSTAPPTLLSKASQVYYSRKFATKATEKPDSLRFTDSSIVYRQTVQTHAIAAHYHDIPAKELEPFAAALKDAIYLYLQDYRIDPEQVDVMKWSAIPASYILTFSSVNGSPRWVMRVRVE